VATLLLVRHGETDWNRDGRFQGHADPSLNARGRRQAEELADRLGDVPLTAVYTSDLRRASETAEVVGLRKGVPVVADRDLREIDVGSWAGRTRAEIGDDDWDGETYEQHRERVLAALRSIAAEHPNGDVLVVTHGGSLRRVQEATLGAAQDVLENCDVWSVAVRDGTIRPLD
jgi:2,3-bisphosphoglycerate-dependent phosphoglycerate mutase